MKLKFQEKDVFEMYYVKNQIESTILDAYRAIEGNSCIQFSTKLQTVQVTAHKVGNNTVIGIIPISPQQALNQEVEDNINHDQPKPQTKEKTNT